MNEQDLRYKAILDELVRVIDHRLTNYEEAPEKLRELLESKNLRTKYLLMENVQARQDHGVLVSIRKQLNAGPEVTDGQLIARISELIQAGTPSERYQRLELANHNLEELLDAARQELLVVKAYCWDLEHGLP